jgi:hypothetical protein
MVDLRYCICGCLMHYTLSDGKQICVACNNQKVVYPGKYPNRKQIVATTVERFGRSIYRVFKE